MRASGDDEVEGGEGTGGGDKSMEGFRNGGRGGGGKVREIGQWD